MNYIDLFTNGGLGMEAKPPGSNAGTIDDSPPIGNDKLVEPTQAAKMQEPILTYSQEKKGYQRPPVRLYADSPALLPWRKSFAILTRWTKIPPRTLTDEDIGNEILRCNSLMEHGEIGVALGDMLVTTLCVMQGIMSWENVKGEGITVKHSL